MKMENSLVLKEKEIARLNENITKRRKKCIIKIGRFMGKLRLASLKWDQNRIIRSTRRLGPTGSGVALIFEILLPIGVLIGLLTLKALINIGRTKQPVF